MRTTYDHPCLPFTGLLHVFGVRVHGQTEILGLEEFRVVASGVHAEHDRIESRVNALRKPSLSLWKQPRSGKPAAARFKNRVVASGNGGTRTARQCQRKAVHCASANGDKVHVHAQKILKLDLVGPQEICLKRGQQRKEQRIVRINVHLIHDCRIGSIKQ